ncbi:MAG: thioredoxin family protein [Saprospirales bacterium]|nr:MAG: thioredoxin family protein [Saprospirales bacterium]
MKYIILALTLGLMAFQINAQAEDYEPAHEGWHVMLNDAYQESQQTGKPIMAYFTGSDWCPPCRRFSAAVINKPEFNEWAKDNVVLLEVDSPRRKQVPQEIQQQNQHLSQAFNVRGVPRIWVFNMNQNGETGEMEVEALGSTGFVPSVEDFTSQVEDMIN